MEAGDYICMFRLIISLMVAGMALPGGANNGCEYMTRRGSP